MWKVEERSNGMSVCDGGGGGRGVHSTLTLQTHQRDRGKRSTAQRWIPPHGYSRYP